MKAVIDSLIFHDDEGPVDPQSCWIVVQALIRCDIDPAGGDTFLFYATTPDGLKSSLNSGYRFGKGLLIVETYSREMVTKALEKLVSRIQADEWPEFTTKMRQYGEWEFEDYTAP